MPDRQQDASSSETFVANASNGDRYEIMAGSMAAERGRSDAVRMFGQMMVEHHTTTMHQLQAALMSSEVTQVFPDLQPPAELDERREGLLRRLREASDEEFDRTYLDQQRLAHEETAMLLRTYAQEGDNAQLRSVALGGLPMIERHLRAVQRVGMH
jgi:putative membrane protein